MRCCERVCLFLVPRLTPVERPSSFLWSVFLRSCAVVRMTRTVFPSVPSCEQYLGHCAVDLLCDARDDSSSTAQENCSCTVISIHFITEKNRKMIKEKEKEKKKQ